MFMAEFDLNLSNRPFPAYRLINIALVLILGALAGVSVWQAVGFSRYSELARSIRSEEQESRVEAEALGKRVTELESRLDRPESTAKLNEIVFLNHLILRKDFSWTRLFGVLEEMVPDNVHFTNLTPEIGENGGTLLRLGVRAKSIADVTQFIQRIEMSPLFENVLVTNEQKSEAAITTATDVEVTLSAVYYPEKAQ
jgi:Tfp pilus assembly protein PilN